MPRRAHTAVAKPSSIAQKTGDGPTDQVLIQACMAGDQAAWRTLVERYARLVYSIPIRRGLDESSADDVFQMVFEVLLKQLPQLREHRSLPKWLITAAQRISWRLINQSKRQPVGAEASEMGESADEVAAKWEEHVLVREALNRLGSRCRDLLKALYFEPGPVLYRQIAARLDLPVGSIGPTRARCLEKLIGLLPDLQDDLER